MSNSLEKRLYEFACESEEYENNKKEILRITNEYAETSKSLSEAASKRDKLKLQCSKLSPIGIGERNELSEKEQTLTKEIERPRIFGKSKVQALKEQLKSVQDRLSEIKKIDKLNSLELHLAVTGLNLDSLSTAVTEEVPKLQKKIDAYELNKKQLDKELSQISDSEAEILAKACRSFANKFSVTMLRNIYRTPDTRVLSGMSADIQVKFLYDQNEVIWFAGRPWNVISVSKKDAWLLSRKLVYPKSNFNGIYTLNERMWKKCSEEERRLINKSGDIAFRNLCISQVRAWLTPWNKVIDGYWWLDEPRDDVLNRAKCVNTSGFVEDMYFSRTVHNEYMNPQIPMGFRPYVSIALNKGEKDPVWEKQWNNANDRIYCGEFWKTDKKAMNLSVDYRAVEARAQAHINRIYGSGTPDRTSYEDIDAIEKSMRENYGSDWSKDI